METLLKEKVSPVVSQVLSAGTLQEADNRILKTIEQMEKEGQQLKCILRFIDNAVSELASLPSSKLSYQQWNRVKNASLSLQQSRNQLLGDGVPIKNNG